MRVSALRMWLRRERAGDHRRWVEGPSCPVCDTRKLVVTHVRQDGKWARTAYECDDGHKWHVVERVGVSPELWLTGSAP